MEKYVTYFDPFEDCYYIELTDVNDSKWGKEIWKGIINEDQIFDTLEDARESLKNAKKNIVMRAKVKDARRFVIRDREGGNEITRARTLQQATDIIEEFENEDKENDVYVENFYEVYDSKEGYVCL